MLLSKSVSILESFKKVRRNHGGRALAEAKENRRDGRGWKPPQEGHCKLNTDAAVRENRLGLGAVIRDGDGNILLVAKEMVQLATDPKIVEALAMRFGLQLPKTHAFKGWRLNLTAWT